MDEKTGQPRAKESNELRARLARELVETRVLLVEATDSLRRAADVPAMVRAEIPRRLHLAFGRHPLSSTLAFALAGFVLARLVVGGVTGGSGPAAGGVGAFFQVVFDDLAQKVAGLDGFSGRRSGSGGGIGGGGGAHPAILGGGFVTAYALKQARVRSDTT